VNARVRKVLEEAFGADWRTAWKESSTFLWIHYFDPHVPYFAREPGIADYAPEFLTDPSDFPAGWDLPKLKRAYPKPGPELAQRLWPLYRSEVRYVDEHLRLLDEEIGFDDEDVLLVFTSDHGEALADHDRIGHGETLFEESVRVPLLFHWPSRLSEPARVDVPVSILDIFPTLAQLLSLPLRDSPQGRELSVLPDSKPLDGERIFLSTERARPPLHAIRQGRWKLVARQDSVGPSRLFDLALDPGESEDVAAQHPDIVDQLEAGLEVLQQGAVAPQTVGVESERDREQLRALGY
jgi:arylsulfatase A-like enzyme